MEVSTHESRSACTPTTTVWARPAAPAISTIRAAIALWTTPSTIRAASATRTDAPVSTTIWTDITAAALWTAPTIWTTSSVFTAIWPGTNYGDTGPSIVLSPILLFILLYTNCDD